MEVHETRSRHELEACFRRLEGAHAYGLGNLDEPFWSSLRAFVATEAGETKAAVMLLEALGVPMIYAIGPPADEATIAVLEHIGSEIPVPCAVTIAKDVVARLPWQFQSAGSFLKMRLSRGGDDLPASRLTERLSVEDFEELSEFLSARAYTKGEGGFFRRYMMEIGPYYCVRSEGRIVAAGGVHVCSERFGAAALGNIATDPEHRGSGYALEITRALCSELHRTIPLIALNVRADNVPAYKCYLNAGFEPVLVYEEGWIKSVTS